MVRSIRDTNNGNDEFADKHAQGTPDEKRSTTKLFNGPERDGGRADINESGYETDEEGVMDSAQFLEESGAEVEDEVDTSPLLHHLEGGTKDGTAKIATGGSEATLEAVQPAIDVATLGDDLEFVLVVCNDLGKFLLNEFGVRRLTSEAAQDIGSFVQVATLDKVTRRFREEEETSTENDGP